MVLSWFLGATLRLQDYRRNFYSPILSLNPRSITAMVGAGRSLLDISNILCFQRVGYIAETFTAGLLILIRDTMSVSKITKPRSLFEKRGLRHHCMAPSLVVVIESCENLSSIYQQPIVLSRISRMTACFWPGWAHSIGIL